MPEPVDPWSKTDRLSPDLLDALVTRLESRGRYPYFMEMLVEYLDAMQIDGALTVLDLGCGTGLASRTIARRQGFKGTVTGIDLSPYLVEAATRIAAEEGLGDRLRFLVGDSRRIDAADGAFDAVVVHTLLSHVDEPASVLREVARVCAPGGMVGIFDGDYGSLTFGHPDAATAKAADEALVSAAVTSARVMRDMPRLLRTAGLEFISAFPHVLAETGTADYWLSALESYRRLLATSGVMTEAEADAWAETLLADSRDGTFFGSCNFYSYVARRR